MKPPLRPADEQRRLEALRRYNLLDTVPEQALDELTALAGRICETPIALISLVDEQRQWFKSKVGVSISETPRDVSFSTYVIGQRDLFIVPDASLDPRFAGSPLVAGDPAIRFYAGAPLITPDGLVLGTLCVMDRVPRELTSLQRETLGALSRQAMAQLELRRQTRELIDSEARLRIVTDNARAGLVVVSHERRYVYANRTYAEILGLPSPDIVGQRVQDVLADIYEAQVAPRLDRAFAGERVAYELRRPAADGERIYAVRYEPTEVNGAVTLVVVVITEITEQRQAEMASGRLAAIVEGSTDAIIGKDLEGIVTSWNDGAERIFGYTAAEMVGTPVLRLIPSDRRAEEDRILDSIRRNESIAHFDTVRLTRDGRRIDVSVAASPIRDATGRVIGASKVARDISERKRAESALREERDRAQRYLDTADVILLALDLDARITGINRKSCDLLGWTEDELIGRDWVETCLPERCRQAGAQKFNGLVGGDISIVENPVLTKNAKERLIEWHNRVLRDDDGRVVGTFSSGADVTERRTLEEQYHQAQKMEAVGRLAGGVAHDFNNVLTAILGNCELLLESKDRDQEDRADISEIYKAGVRAASLTRQLLAFSRKQIIEPTVLDLNQLVDDLVPMLERLIGEDIRVGTCLQPALPAIIADRGQIEQVIMNLAVNARDAMPHGGRLTIETAGVDLDEPYAKTHLNVKPGSYVALTVSDNGTGMTPEVQARLFEPFFTTKEVGKGTGLGMATVHGIVMRSGGSVGVYSEVGKGTSFNVYFPAAGHGEFAVEAAPMERARRGGETVLLVEDAEGLRELTARLLRREGYTVLVAANAGEALELFEQNPSIDIVLTDVVMPGASGPTLITQLTERRRTLKVVFMSGYTEDAITQHGVLKPGIAFLHKPFTSETLGRKLREVLDR